MSKFTTLSKPLPSSNAAAALAFAEAKPSTLAKPSKTIEKRVFHAPQGYRRLTINLSHEMHKKLRLVAIEQDTTATKLIEQLLAKHL